MNDNSYSLYLQIKKESTSKKKSIQKEIDEYEKYRRMRLKIDSINSTDICELCGSQGSEHCGECPEYKRRYETTKKKNERSKRHDV